MPPLRLIDPASLSERVKSLLLKAGEAEGHPFRGNQYVVAEDFGLKLAGGSLGRMGYHHSTDPSVRISAQVDKESVFVTRLDAVTPGQGAGGKALERLKSFASASGRRLELKAGADTPELQPKLNAFYEKHGGVKMDSEDHPTYIWHPPVKASIKASAKPVTLDSPNQRHAAMAVLRAARLVSVGNFLAGKLQDRCRLLEAAVAGTIRMAWNGTSDQFGVVQQVEEQVKQAFEWMKGEAADDCRELLDILHSHTSAAAGEHFGVTGEIPSPTGDLPLILGAPLADHLDKMRDDLIFRLSAGIRSAHAAGCSADETVERLGLEGEAVKASNPNHDEQGRFASWSDLVAAHPVFKEVYNRRHLEINEAQALTDHLSNHFKVPRVEVKRLEPNDDRTIAEYYNNKIALYKTSDAGTVMHEYAHHLSEGKDHPSLAHGPGFQSSKRQMENYLNKVAPIREGRIFWRIDKAHGNYTPFPNSTVQGTIHATDPLTAISIGIRLFDTTDNSLMRFIQGAINSMANAADTLTAEEMDDEESEVRMGFTWVSAADAKVCDFCEYMDGGKWDTNKEPVDDSPELETEPPAHYNCRCSLLPCDLDADLPSGNFKSYLASFSDAEQKQAFGASNVAMWRRGEMTDAQLMGQQSNKMSLESFRELEPRLELDVEKYGRMGAAGGKAANKITLERRAARAIGDLESEPFKASEKVFASGTGQNNNPEGHNQFWEGVYVPGGVGEQKVIDDYKFFHGSNPYTFFGAGKQADARRVGGLTSSDAAREVTHYHPKLTRGRYVEIMQKNFPNLDGKPTGHWANRFREGRNEGIKMEPGTYMDKEGRLHGPDADADAEHWREDAHTPRPHGSQRIEARSYTDRYEAYTILAEWTEELHPGDSHGRFTNGLAMDAAQDKPITIRPQQVREEAGPYLLKRMRFAKLKLLGAHDEPDPNTPGASNRFYHIEREDGTKAVLNAEQIKAEAIKRAGEVVAPPPPPWKPPVIQTISKDELLGRDSLTHPEAVALLKSRLTGCSNQAELDKMHIAIENGAKPFSETALRRIVRNSQTVVYASPAEWSKTYSQPVPGYGNSIAHFDGSKKAIVTSYPDEWTMAHEMGHAADFNSGSWASHEGDQGRRYSISDNPEFQKAWKADKEKSYPRLQSYAFSQTNSREGPSCLAEHVQKDGLESARRHAPAMTELLLKWKFLKS